MKKRDQIESDRKNTNNKLQKIQKNIINDNTDQQHEKREDLVKLKEKVRNI